MHKDKNISILIVTHNHANYIENLLQSLIKFNYENVYICDAASTDSTPQILANSSFAHQVLFKKKLEGFSKNNNDLIKHFNLDTSYYLLLNPDVYFTEDFISVLASILQSQPKVGIVAPLIKYPNNQIQTTWKKFPSFIEVVKKRLGLRKINQEKQMPAGVIDWCLGACMLIKKELKLDSNTLLDQRYRLYCEDIDICFHAKNEGYLVVGTDKTFVYHHLNELSSKNIFSKYNRWNIESIFKFILKWNWKFLIKK